VELRAGLQVAGRARIIEVRAKELRAGLQVAGRARIIEVGAKELRADDAC
jgi:hypothetical protein